MNHCTKSDPKRVVLLYFFYFFRGGLSNQHISEVFYYTEHRLFYKHNERNRNQGSVHNIETLLHMPYEYATATLNSTLTHSTRAAAHKNVDDLLTAGDDTNPAHNFTLIR